MLTVFCRLFCLMLVPLEKENIKSWITLEDKEVKFMNIQLCGLLKKKISHCVENI